jgi:hypothetical protein
VGRVRIHSRALPLTVTVLTPALRVEIDLPHPAVAPKEVDGRVERRNVSKVANFMMFPIFIWFWLLGLTDGEGLILHLPKS